MKALTKSFVSKRLKENWFKINILSIRNTEINVLNGCERKNIEI